MRFKLIPEPPASIDRVRAAQRAVPLVPGDEDDCCARLQRRLGMPSRDVARTWLTVLRALELVDRTDAGFTRTDVDPTPEHLRAAFLDRILLARETLAVLETVGSNEEPMSPEAVFERLRESVPTYEHHKNPDTWEAIWQSRTADLLGWLERLGLVRSVDAERDLQAYVLTDCGRAHRRDRRRQ